MPHVLFYDGACGLCHRGVRFVLARDHAARFRFAPLQGAHARAVLLPRGVDPVALDTQHVVTEAGVLLSRGRAVRFVLSELGGAAGVLGVLRYLPVPLLDLGYRIVARSRRCLFGRADECQLPEPAARERFLE